VGVMREKYGEDIDGRYVELAQAAMDARARGSTSTPSLGLRFAPTLPGESTRPYNAHASLDNNPENPRLAVNLARLYRESGSPAQGAELLQGFAFPVGGDRVFWHEWGTCASKAGDRPLARISHQGVSPG
jgi:hypothetical protein